MSIDKNEDILDMVWQPIETVPEDELIGLYFNDHYNKEAIGKILIIDKDKNEKYYVNISVSLGYQYVSLNEWKNPTHWRRLHVPPEVKE